jgi:hypothetical protein
MLTDVKKIKHDIDATIMEMMEAMKSASGNDWTRLRVAALHTLQSRKAQFNYLVVLRVNNEISGDYLLNMLEEEREMMLDELNAEIIISRDKLNEALRMAMKVLEKAIERVL